MEQPLTFPPRRLRTGSTMLRSSQVPVATATRMHA